MENISGVRPDYLLKNHFGRFFKWAILCKIEVATFNEGL
jgi:hypothetical protein